MRKLLLSFLGAIIMIVILYSLLISFVENNINNEIKKYKSKLGEKYIIGNDTLIILDYSMFDENFTLSNGNKVSSIVVFKDAIK
jgi:hypothetical protein